MIPPLLHASLSSARALRGPALEAMANPPWEEAEARVLVVRLSPIRDVDRSSSHLILFAETRAALPRAFIDFAFLPDRGDRESLALQPGAPWFPGAASGRSPADFDLVLVSNAFPLELVNLPRLLSTADIPLRASSRDEGGRPWPVVILGGSSAGQCSAIADLGGTSGPACDSLVEGIFLGEGEGAIGPLAALLSDRRRPRAERLADAASLPGFWPALRPGATVKRRILSEAPKPLLSWIPFDTPEAKTARLQITAGCPGLCSFCFEGWDRRPYRETPLAEVLEAARAIRSRNGVETLEVYSFNFNTHSDVFALLFELGRIFRTVNFMSQRLDVLASTPGLLAAELAADKRSFTLGVEGISGRMRAYYRKGISTEELESLLDRLVGPGVREVKLFYILSGFEDDGDLAEFEAFARRLAARREAVAKGLRILASAGYLVRLPATPLSQAPPVLDEGSYAAIARRMAAICGETGIEWRTAVHFDEYCVDQLLSLGDGRLLPWFLGLAGAGIHEVYDGSLARGMWKDLEAFARGRGLLGPAFVAEKAAPVLGLPHRDAEAFSAVLGAEYEKARAFVDRVPCLGASCRDCGACDEPSSRAFIAGHKTQTPPPGAAERIERLLRAKRAFETALIEVDRPAFLAGARAAAQEAWLLATLSGIRAGAWSKVFSARLAAPLPEGDFGAPEGSTGYAIFELAGPSKAALEELAAAAGFTPLAGGEGPEILSLRLEIPEGLGGLASAGTPGAADDRPLGERLVADWLRASHLAFTERREGPGRRYEIAPRDLAKKAVLSALVAEGVIELRLGRRARASALLEGLGPRLAPLVRARARAES